VKRFSYDEQDYAFGQTMLTLRTSIGLTQVGLAKLLGVSRRAVGEWEAGSSYPKVEHLKELIVLGIQHHAFPVGREEEEIRILWQASHQKILIDEQWLSSLQQPGRPLSPPATPLSREDVTTSEEAKSPPVASGPRVDWGQALAIPSFYGREQEKAQLIEWVLQERCRVVSLLGMGGIGKSALAVNVMYQLAEHFDVVIFRSLRDAPSCEELLDDCLRVLDPQPLRVVPTSLQQRMSLLLEYLRISRTLLVLDNLESLLQERDVQGHMRPGFEGYERLLRLVAETSHQSCLLLTSREKPAELRPLEGKRSLVRSMRLSGLDTMACQQVFTEKEVVGSQQEQTRLAEVYTGNPLALKIVAETIMDLFDGEIGQFLTKEVAIFGSIADLLTEQFARLSSQERTVLYWLAIVREPITLDELQAVLVVPLPRVQVLEAVNGLRRRSLIEPGQRQGSFALQSVVLEYVTTVLIEETSLEIRQPTLNLLIEHGLEQANAREYVRQAQERLLLVPILASLQRASRRRMEVEEQLSTLLDQLRQRADYAQGYGPANLIALLRLLRGHLCGLDLSQLSIRGAYLQGIEMQDANLAEALMRECVWTENFNAITAVAISRCGQYWAAASWQGEVRVWCQEGQCLHQVWRAHTDIVWALSFSPDELTLASGSLDGSLKLWEVEHGALLWSGWQTGGIEGLAFAPDGGLLASGGHDASVRLWDAQQGTLLEVLQHPGPVFALAWSPEGHLLASGDFAGTLRLWQTQPTGSASVRQALAGHSSWVRGLAFAPEGNLLASGSWDGTIKLWEVGEEGSFCLHQTLVGHTDKVQCVAWSADGATLASGSFDHTIWLWDAKQGSARVVLQGHSAAVTGLAFMPDSLRLLSSSENGTLRLWGVQRGESLRVIQGYEAALYDLTWSPDGTELASAGADSVVSLWQVERLREGMPLGVLRGHERSVNGVAWHPGGRLLASSGMDSTIRLWDPTTRKGLEIIQNFDHSGTPFWGLAWSPDGKSLASGTVLQGVLLWEAPTGSQRTVGRGQSTWIRRVAWSADGTRVVAGGDDGHVYVWDASDGRLLKRLAGHQGAVMCVAWSADGTLLASGGGSRDSGELFVWDGYSGECIYALQGLAGIIYTVAWNRVGDQLISGGSNGRLSWWGLQHGECVRVQEAHQGTVCAVTVSPEGSRLASCGDDGAIMLWDLQSGVHLGTLRRDRPYERLNITGIRGLSEAQKASLQALGAFEETGGEE
jgi:WD40 repeat protein/transcriptional regulator with XRE-family HTH domain